MTLDAHRPSRAMTWGIHAFIAGTLKHADWIIRFKPRASRTKALIGSVPADLGGAGARSGTSAVGPSWLIAAGWYGKREFFANSTRQGGKRE